MKKVVKAIFPQIVLKRCSGRRSSVIGGKRSLSLEKPEPCVGGKAAREHIARLGRYTSCHTFFGFSSNVGRIDGKGERNSNEWS